MNVVTVGSLTKTNFGVRYAGLAFVLRSVIKNTKNAFTRQNILARIKHMSELLNVAKTTLA